MRNNAVVPGVTSLIRWQSHWHVVRQSWPFFQNDFAGRIANRVMQTSNALRECVVSTIRAVWYIVVYGVSALVLMGHADWRLALPTVLWFAGYVFFLRHFVPPRATSPRRAQELRSQVMGRVVDSYTNILTVKLFSRARDEDAYVRDVIDEHTAAIAAHMRLITTFMATLSTMNALLLVGTATIGIALWGAGEVGAGVVATALPLAWTIANVAGWVSWGGDQHLREHRRGAGGHGDDRRPAPARRRAGRARALEVSRGEIAIERLTFTHGRSDARAVLADLNLVIRPGERVGVVGRSGAGKSTLVNLLLRFHELRGRQHPHRRPGHPQRDAGEPARRDRHGDSGHLAAAPLDRRQHRLRPARRDAGAGRGRGAEGAGARVHPRPRTGSAAPATTPTSASAASSSRAASASASRSRAWCSRMRRS